MRYPDLATLQRELLPLTNYCWITGSDPSVPAHFLQPPPPHNNFDLSVISSLRFFFFFLVSCRCQKNCLVIRLWKHFNMWNPESVPASHLDVFSPPPFATSALFSALCSQPQARVHSFLTVNSLFFSHAGCNCDRGCSCNRPSMYMLFLYVSAGAALA